MKFYNIPRYSDFYFLHELGILLLILLNEQTKTIYLNGSGFPFNVIKKRLHLCMPNFVYDYNIYNDIIQFNLLNN